MLETLPPWHEKELSSGLIETLPSPPSRIEQLSFLRLPFQPKFDRDVVFRFHWGTVQQSGMKTPLADRAYYRREQEDRPVHWLDVRHSTVAPDGGAHSYCFC
jgi:hypothetical protein